MRGRRTAVGLAAVAALLWSAAVLISATYCVPNANITYTTKLAWSSLVGLVQRVGWREVKSTLGVYDAAFWVSLAIVTAAVPTATKSNRRRTVLGLASPAVLLFPLNLFAFSAAAVDLLFPQPYDGEFLAEGWPQNYVYALWTLATGIFALYSSRGRRVGTVGIADHGPSGRVSGPQNDALEPTARD